MKVHGLLRQETVLIANELSLGNYVIGAIQSPKTNSTTASSAALPNVYPYFFPNYPNYPNYP